MSSKLPKSKYQIGDKMLHDLTHEELINAVDDLWDQKNKRIREIEAERDGYLKVLSSSFPIHSLWRSCIENVSWIALGCILATVVIANN